MILDDFRTKAIANASRYLTTKIGLPFTVAEKVVAWAKWKARKEKATRT